MNRLMPDTDFKLFKTIVSFDQPQLLKCLSQYLETKYDKVVTTGDYIYAIGDIPIALVAHMDTVFSVPAEVVYYDREENVMWSPYGLGADDRAGVFAILKIISAGFKPTIIFTTDEEKGCIGSEKFVITNIKPITDLRYIIQLDRRGEKDCVFYDCDNAEFTKYVENFGFKTALGSFTDISYICPTWEIAGVNLSVGYYNEHNPIETLHVDYLYDTIDKVKTMLSETDIPFFKYIPSKSSYSWFGSYSKSKDNWFSKYDDNPDEDDDNDSIMYNFFDEIDLKNCSRCNKSYCEYELIPVYDSKDNINLYCGDCCVTEVEWCDDCGAAYENDGVTPTLCYKCRKKKNNKKKRGLKKNGTF